MKTILSKWNGVVLLIIALLIFGGSAAVILSTQSSVLAAQTREIADMKSKISLKEQTVLKAEQDSVQAVTGMDANRAAKDNKIAESFFKEIMNWSSLDEYNQIRTNLAENYGLRENSSFLTVFMPPVVDSVSPDGSHYNRIDTLGLNVSYEDMDSYVTGIKNTTYSYASFVTFSSASANGNEGFATVMATYDIDVDGNISNLYAYTVTD